MTPNPEIVALLVDMNIDDDGTLTHQDGRPFTNEDHALFGQATRAELDAARNLLETQMDFHKSQAEAMHRICQLTEPYFAEFPHGTPLEEALATMPADERAEVERLMDEVAPGGTFVILGGGA